MTTATIAALNLLTPPMDGTELLEIERAGTSYKINAGQLAQAPPASVAVTSGAVPVDLDPLGLLYIVTTGGTGDETLNILNPALDGNTTNAEFIGRPLIVYLPSLTDPGDRVLITVEGSGVIQVYGAPNFDGVAAIQDIVLDYAGALLALTWTGESWAANFSLNGSSGFYGYNPATPQSASLHGGDATTSTPAQAVSVVGGQGNVAHEQGATGVLRGGNSEGATKGGNVEITGGTSATGDGGDVIISPGNATGVIQLLQLPAADPLVSGALYTTAGVLHVSAG